MESHLIGSLHISLELEELDKCFESYLGSALNKVSMNKSQHKLQYHLFFQDLAKPVLSLILLLGMALPGFAQTRTTSVNRNIERPNLKFQVTRQAGQCPTTVGLWSILLPLEGGADHIAVADTIRFAGSARVARTNRQFVEYEAPLKPEFVSCVGQASSTNFRAYRFQFRSGKVYFQVNPSFAGSSAIVSQQVVTGRPYVLWQARD